MPIFNIQYTIRKTNILFILPYNQANISHTINILRKLIYQPKLDFYIIVRKKVIFKDNQLTIHNIKKAIYYQ